MKAILKFQIKIFFYVLAFVMIFGCTTKSIQPCKHQAPLLTDKLDQSTATKDPEKEIVWYDAQNLTIEGKGWSDTENFYQRLPAKAKDIVPESVWRLSKNSAGICVRFATDSKTIAAKWTLTSSSLGMHHMPSTGVSGLDLYVRENGRWQWIANSAPQGVSSTRILAEGIPVGPYEYMLYLPLYNSVKSLEIGIDPQATLAKAPSRPTRSKPICFYGTSIVQGGCASRPGMVYTAILGRRLDWPVINLGFSGSGKMETELADLLIELDVACYVIDCMPNMTASMINERTESFIRKLRKAKPNIPIVLVENVEYQHGRFSPTYRQLYITSNQALQTIYKKLQKENWKDIYYIKGELLYGNDFEATVDGIHASDLGFYRIANTLEPILQKILFD